MGKEMSLEVYLLADGCFTPVVAKPLYAMGVSTFREGGHRLDQFAPWLESIGKALVNATLSDLISETPARNQ